MADIKFDASGGISSYLEYSLANLAAVYVKVEGVLIASATLAAWYAVDPSFTGDFVELDDAIGTRENVALTDDVAPSSYDSWTDSLAADITNPPIADIPHIVELWRPAAGSGYFKVDGISHSASSLSPSVGWQVFRLGYCLWSAPQRLDSFVAGKITIGTTDGGSDILVFDPATAPDLSPFTLTGSVTLEGAPPAPALDGVSIAFDSGPLDDTPSWQRIDNYPGITIQQVTTERGRMDETEKVAVGLCSIYGTDTAGVMDPTNATGPFFGKLDPVKQVGVAIWNPVTSVWATRYTGYWDQLTYVIDPSGKFATFQLDCVDAMDILTDAEVIPGAAGTTPPAASAGNAFYASQQVNDRINAALADGATALLGITWPATLLNIFSGNVLMQDSVYSPRSPVLQVIQDASDAEFPMVSNFFVDRNGVIDFRGRLARFDPTNPTYNINFWKIGDDLAFAADSTVARMVTPFQFTRGKKNLINAAYCAPQGILPADSAGQLVSDPTSIGKYAVRSTSFENLLVEAGDEGPPLDANAECKLYANYLVDNYKDPHNRPQTVVVKGLPPSDPMAARIWALLGGAELSDVVTLKTTHPGGGGFDNVDFFIEKISEVIVPRGGTATGDDVTSTYEISPRALFVVNPFS